MANPIVYVPASALPRVIMFDTRFESALQSAREQWHTKFTENVNLAATEAFARFPVLSNEAAFRLFDGIPNFRSLSNKFYDITWREWQDGVKAHIDQISLPTFHGWDREPANMAQAAMDLRPVGIGELLMSPPTLQLDGLPWFAHTHPANPVTPVAAQVIDNDMYSQAVGTAALDAIDLQFMGFRGPSLRPLYRRLAALIVPKALYHLWKTVVDPSPEMVNQGGTNKWRGQVELIYSPEIDFHSDGSVNSTVYFALSTARGGKPFTQVTGVAWNGEAIETRYKDTTSDMFKDTGMISISKILKWDVKPSEPVMDIIRVSTAAEV
jgi:hypothetical protein